MKKNDFIELEITAMSSEGSGVGRYEGLAVFVPMTAIGDRIKAKILKVKSNCAFAKVEEIIATSPDRRDIDCTAFTKCGGCVYRHITYEAELCAKQKKVEDAIKRIGGIDMPSRPICGAVSPERYRNKAQYPIADDYTVGFYANHSHRIIPSGDCRLQPEEFNEISKIFTEWINSKKLSVYNEETGKGLVRHLYIRKAVATNELMVCIVINGNTLPCSDELVDMLLEKTGESLKAVVLNINKAKTNVILGDKCKNLYGDGYIYDILCGVKVRINPLSFYQVNRDMAERLYQKAAEYAQPQDKTVLDLYCGAGTIGLSMAGTAKEIIGVEIVPEAVQDAEFNAQNNNIDNVRFICSDAAKAAEALNKEGISPDVVIVDPPRKGCSQELLKIIANGFCPERLVYVSCDPATLARDIKILDGLGYKLQEYTPFDLFPRTHHIESVVCLSREKADDYIRISVHTKDLQAKAN